MAPHEQTIAVVNDARLSARVDASVVVERLLSVTGEDAITINRKHQSMVTAKLPTRFVIVSNELPRLGDSSGALTGRMVLLRLTRTFYGREDLELGNRLTRELPGILLWALDGLARLRARGRFVQPAAGRNLIATIEDIASPINEFVRDRCIVGVGCRVRIPEIFEEWRRWCEKNGRREAGTIQTFGRDLLAAVATVESVRGSVIDGERVREYRGIRIRAWDEAATEPDEHQARQPEVSADIADTVHEFDSEPFAVSSVSATKPIACDGQNQGNNQPNFTSDDEGHYPLEGAMGLVADTEDSDSARPAAPSDSSPAGPSVPAAELPRLRADLARRLRAAGITWDVLRDTAELADPAGGYLPERLDDADGKNLKLADTLLAALAGSEDPAHA